MPLGTRANRPCQAERQERLLTAAICGPWSCAQWPPWGRDWSFWPLEGRNTEQKSVSVSGRWSTFHSQEKGEKVNLDLLDVLVEGAWVISLYRLRLWCIKIVSFESGKLHTVLLFPEWVSNITISDCSKNEAILDGKCSKSVQEKWGNKSHDRELEKITWKITPHTHQIITVRIVYAGMAPQRGVTAGLDQIRNCKASGHLHSQGFWETGRKDILTWRHPSPCLGPRFLRASAQELSIWRHLKGLIRACPWLLQECPTSMLDLPSQQRFLGFRSLS